MFSTLTKVVSNDSSLEITVAHKCHGKNKNHGKTKSHDKAKTTATQNSYGKMKFSRQNKKATTKLKSDGKIKKPHQN